MLYVAARKMSTTLVNDSCGAGWPSLSSVRGPPPPPCATTAMRSGPSPAAASMAR